ncbi:AF0104/ALDC/Ptd012-like protein [Dioscorea alata]|uniref:AF0104/ALDC/Ptd012-like protein n=1 Tax=Dioscorea alata TaxID=55571 RepID=A0ACB7VI21_DIOAL|nr:AF0104/ALDC/Ptd012-like protein [Dioscorea alata]
MGLCVLAGSDSVSNVTLRQPMQTPATTIVLRGRFEILSLSDSMLPSSLPTMQCCVSVSLVGPQGQVIDDMVAGPTFNHLPEDNDNDGDENTTAVNVSLDSED